VIDFSGLYRAHARDVHRFATLLSGDPALADDVVSETFIRLWSARARVDLATVKSYLLTIARNLILHEWRHLRRLADLDHRRAASGPGPEERLRVRQELESVLAALQELPEVDRAAVLMRAEEGLSYQEIAAALGISLAAAKVKVHRARLKLAEARLRRGQAEDRKEKETAR
jgi:RNA polymerase sigma-70 factor, ECF subfamily